MAFMTRVNGDLLLDLSPAFGSAEGLLVVHFADPDKPADPTFTVGPDGEELGPQGGPTGEELDPRKAKPEVLLNSRKPVDWMVVVPRPNRLSATIRQTAPRKRRDNGTQKKPSKDGREWRAWFRPGGKSSAAR